ncbi:GrpB family protein, partial [Paenibacillus sp. KS1]|uniref:GrpB family protein n=1 Tax=Paenibacillus sp. KS1 TaxID=1849249 RepID=UPI000B01BA10
MGSRPVVIEDYNDAWPVMFNELKDILRDKLGELALTIEHVGSTSVPGLSAKPIIDIDIVIDSMSLLPQVVGMLSELGYFHEGNFRSATLSWTE